MAIRYDLPRGLVVIESPIGPQTVLVEIASEPPDLEHGLMQRSAIAADAGMLFVMPYEHDWHFFMRDTFVALDMIFIGRDMTIVGIVEHAEPMTETMRGVGRTSLYVLEVNGGWARARSITPGARVRFA